MTKSPRWGELATILALVLIVGTALTAIIAAIAIDLYTTRDVVHDLTLLAFASAATALGWHHRPWAHERRAEPAVGTSYQRTSAALDDPPRA